MLEKLLNEYSVRRSKSDKQRFIEFLTNQNIDFSVDKSKIFKSKNIIIGNPKTAKYIISAHYDTPANLFIPNIILPLNPFLSLLLGFFLSLPILIIFSVLLIPSFSILYDLLYSSFLNKLLCFIIYEALTIFIFLILLLIVFNFPLSTRYNYNDNTSGIITVLKMQEEISADSKEDICFVLFDNEEKGLLGSRYYKRKYKEELKNQILINIDCVGDGDYIFIFYKNIDQSIIKHINTNPTIIENVVIKKQKDVYCPSDHIGFPQSLNFMTLKKHRKYFYIDKIHTNKDTNLDIENINKVIMLIKNILLGRF